MRTCEVYNEKSQRYLISHQDTWCWNRNRNRSDTEATAVKTQSPYKSHQDGGAGGKGKVSEVSHTNINRHCSDNGTDWQSFK